MINEKRQSLTMRLRSALRIPSGDGGDLALTAALRHVHPADIADAMHELSFPEALAIFNWLDNPRAAEVLDELESDLKNYLIENAPAGRIADLLDRLPMDDAAEIISEADPDRAEALLQDLSERAPQDAEEVRELLSYEEGTAGRLLTDRFIRLSPLMTVEQAFDAFRNIDPEVETLTYMFVIEPVAVGPFNEERLVGVLSLRELVKAQRDQLVRDIMNSNPITAHVDMDQEEVARLITKYELLAIPVIDRAGNLAGIITVDDVVHILVEEQTEDVLALGAVSATERSYMSMGVTAVFQQRFGWLLLLFVTETFTGGVMRSFEGLLSEAVWLSFFVPLLIGSGGNAGSQTVTTITRALALGDIQFGDWLKVLWRETRVGLMLGACLGAVGFVRALVWQRDATAAEIVALSMVIIIVWANLVGSVLPIAARRLGFDPAVLSAPLIATLVDATGLFFFFTIARYMLGL